MMALQYVLCPVTGGEEDGPALRAALQVAARFDAHVRALFVRPSVSAAIPYLGEGLTGTIVENIVAAAGEASDESMVSVKTHVDAAVQAAGLDLSKLSIRVTEGVVEDEVAAASALMASLPFIRKASSVEVITMTADQDEADILEDVRDALSIRGMTATMRTVNRQSSVDGAHLMIAALQAGPDLIVMGGYGHSRLRQLVLGGVTRHMLKHAPVPVLMAH